MPQPFFVTRPLLPSVDSMHAPLASIWEAQWLTNGGHMHTELERRLAEWLDVPHVALFANGTLALAAAIRVGFGDPRPGDEVITTPYSFVATAQAIELAGFTPRFIDIAADSVNLDPAAVAAAIGPRTRGVVPVHCYAIPADTAAFDGISATTGIPIVYDAAHAFGARHEGAALAAHGRLAALSFHATKLFHTGEGGGVVAHTEKDYGRLRRLRNFGFTPHGITEEWGLNAKMSELSAALGLEVLPLVGGEIARRGEIVRRYARGLADIAGISVLRPVSDAGHNHAYLPVVVDDSCALSRDDLHDALAEREVYARKYFHPLITEMGFFASQTAGQRFPRAEALSRRILCLPLYGALTDGDVDAIAATIQEVMR